MSKIHRYFILTAGVILGITAIAKIVSAFGAQMFLLQLDPLTGLSFRHLLLLAAAMELPIACLCLFTNKLKLNTLLIAWISTSFLVYRVGLWQMNWQHPCHCLGNLTDALHISPETADTSMKIILGYLLLGSYATLFWLWLQNRKTSLSKSSKETSVSAT
jgi:uncharacterized membrane protein YGL010W